MASDSYYLERRLISVDGGAARSVIRADPSSNVSGSVGGGTPAAKKLALGSESTTLPRSQRNETTNGAFPYNVFTIHEKLSDEVLELINKE